MIEYMNNKKIGNEIQFVEMFIKSCLKYISHNYYRKVSWSSETYRSKKFRNGCMGIKGQL